jgi:hypothetical protein
MIVIKIGVTKVPKPKIFIGKKGKYLSLVLIDNKHGEDEYGNLGFCSIYTTKEERAAGEKGVIVGNWKEVGGKPKPQDRPQSQGRLQAEPPSRPPVDPEGDSIPF